MLSDFVRLSIHLKIIFIYIIEKMVSLVYLCHLMEEAGQTLNGVGNTMRIVIMDLLYPNSMAQNA